MGWDCYNGEQTLDAYFQVVSFTVGITNYKLHEMISQLPSFLPIEMIHVGLMAIIWDRSMTRAWSRSLVMASRLCRCLAQFADPEVPKQLR